MMMYYQFQALTCIILLRSIERVNRQPLWIKTKISHQREKNEEYNLLLALKVYSKILNCYSGGSLRVRLSQLIIKTIIQFFVFLPVFELLKEGEVLVVPTDNPMSEKEAWLAFRDVVHGLEYRKSLSTLQCICTICQKLELFHNFQILVTF